MIRAMLLLVSMSCLLSQLILNEGGTPKHSRRSFCIDLKVGCFKLHNKTKFAVSRDKSRGNLSVTLLNKVHINEAESNQNYV